jgi:hypothetical protein
VTKKRNNLYSIHPDEWRAHWIRGIHGWRGHWQDIEDPREGSLARSRFNLECANFFGAHAHPASAAAGRAAYSRKLSEIHAELADKLPRQEKQAVAEQTHTTVYDQAIADGWNPKDWLGGSNPKEHALERTRTYRETAERVERRYPAVEASRGAVGGFGLRSVEA